MKAASLIEPKKIAIHEVETPTPAEGEVLINIKACGVCGTDLHIYLGHRPDIQLPRVLGHELAGEVTEVGPGVTEFKTGDRVVVDPVIYCGECYMCKRGKNHICTSVKCLGCQVEGGFREYFTSPVKNVYKIPDNLSWNQAALAEPFAIGAQVFSRSDFSKGDKVVIFGAGTIGLCVLQVFKMHGAEVLITDLVDSRLEVAKSLGADVIVNNSNESLEKAVSEFTEGQGADIIIEAVGHESLLREAMNQLVRGGRIVVLGLNKGETGITEFDFVRTEVDIRGSVLNSMKFSQVVEWLASGAIDPEPLITGIYPVDEINKAFEDILASPADSLKVLVTF